MNTNKQVIAMIILMFMGIAALGANAWFESGHRPEATADQQIRRAEQASAIFARNCRVCHGNQGLGSTGSASLIGPALNRPENTLAYRTNNVGQFQELQTRFHLTIACGRNGTPMPPWRLDQGGALDDYKIGLLVDLITTNAGNAWETALEHAVEQDTQTLDTLANTLREAEAGGNADAVSTARTNLESAQSRFDQGLPIAQPSPSLTQNSCGQRSAAASAAAAPADVPEIDSSGFTANPDHGQELFFANGCNACHGDQGQGLIGPKIAQTTLTFSQVVNQYRTPRQAMPAFPADRVPDADVFDIYSWLQTLE